MSVADTTQGPAAAVAKVEGHSRLAFIDGIRGVAAMMVVVGHALPLAGYPLGGLGDYMGRAGIVAFFLISGYVVALSLDRQTPAVFWTRRFWRLFPVYWLSVAIFTIASGNYTYDAKTWLINVLMIQGFIGATTILPVAWTLGDELVIYAQQSVLGRWLQPSVLVHLGWLWLALFAALAVMTRSTTHDFASLAPLLIFTASAGVALYLRDTTGSRVWIPYMAAMIFVVPVLGYVLLGSPTAYPNSGWTAEGFAVGYLGGIALFVAFYLARQRHLPSTVLWFGATSYAVYLIHPSVLVAFTDVGVSGPVYFVGVVGMSVAASWALHHWVERPSIEFGRARSRRFSQAK